MVQEARKVGRGKQEKRGLRKMGREEVDKGWGVCKYNG